jgi:hypothetical protein
MSTTEKKFWRGFFMVATAVALPFMVMAAIAGAVLTYLGLKLIKAANRFFKHSKQ